MQPEQTQVESRHPDRQKDAEPELRPLHDLAAYLREYSAARPGILALAGLGVGFLLGWRLKP